MIATCKIETKDGSLAVERENWRTSILMTFGRGLAAQTVCITPPEFKAKALAAVLAGEPSPKADLDVVEWLRLLAGSDHAAKVKGLPQALRFIASAVDCEGPEASWVVRSGAEGEAFFETVAAMLRTTTQKEAIERIECLVTFARKVRAEVFATPVGDFRSRINRVVISTALDFVEPDPTAQAGVLTTGQKIVADWEGSLGGEPRELAQAIDAAIARARADISGIEG